MVDTNDPGWPFLRLAPDEQAARKFDNKTHYWVPDPNEGFIIGKVESEADNKVTLMLPDGLSKAMSINDVQEINPPKFEKTEDMANLTFLNEASVLHNLRQRYSSMIIYTYSGLFLVFINPYKMLPIYTDSVANMFVNKRRTEMPPHLFAVSDLAYRNMINDHDNQSMLITGESGAGKTENTKKVISYFARIGASTNKDDAKKKGSLEEQVVQANPAIEAFGNGATNRNYNSSRYGKFIRIHFNQNGKLVGGDIEHYLLEKSRVIKQGPGERSFHIFYQMMTSSKLKTEYSLGDNIRDYRFVSKNEITVPGMNDKEEFDCTDNAFDVMGFSPAEKDGLYRTCAAIMFMGEMTFKQKPREEQAEADDMSKAEKACALFGVDVEKFVGALLKPKVKVGNEWVSKGQTVQQVELAIGALAMAIYSRMFNWLIQRCNKTLSMSDGTAANCIGVLDIAGFEIFDRNSFEQLWINFVNEKLQQFFNHHMFVLEQEEYEREGIQWQFIDFGLDLQACIELIEKPLGVISMLDEECIVPKATDATYVEKLNAQHIGKHPNFQRPKPIKNKPLDAHFAIVHYAGTVNYNADLWLDKNKDPLNDTAVSVLKTAKPDSAIRQFWDDYQTAVDKEEEEKRGRSIASPTKKKSKSGAFMTVSTMYRESLSSLLMMLNSTQPHFIRCIIPNEHKKCGLVDAPLILNQLTCNGVLEGIRICRKGFPNRMVFADFRYRYAILAADEALHSGDLQMCANAMLDKLLNEKKLNPEDFRVGRNKVFFRAGILAKMEELRDAAISVIITKFQCACRGYLALKERQQRELVAEAVFTVQWNARKWLELRKFDWYRLYMRVRPMLSGLQSGAQMKEMEGKLKEMEQKQKADQEQQAKLNIELAQQKEEFENLKANHANQKLMLERRQQEIKEANDLLVAEKNKHAELEAANSTKMKSLEKELQASREKLQTEHKQLKGEADRFRQELNTMQLELAKQQDLNAQLVRQRKDNESAHRDHIDEMEQLRVRCDRLEDQRNKQAEELESCEMRLHAEKRQKEETLKEKRKLEAECKQLTDKLTLLQGDFKNSDQDCRRLEQEIGQWRKRAHDDANLISKLQANIRQLIQRIEDLENELELEQRGRVRAEKLKTEAQNELGELHERIAETNGQLEVQLHLNKSRAQELSTLQRELESKNLSHETNISDLCSMQWITLNNLRNLSQQAQFLENEANRVLDFRKVSAETMGKPLSRSLSVGANNFYKHNQTEYRP